MAETFRAQDQRSRMEQAGEWQLRVTSYRLADQYVCTVDNVSPGRTLARAQAGTREEVEARALHEARTMVRATRILQ